MNNEFDRMLKNVTDASFTIL